MNLFKKYYFFFIIISYFFYSTSTQAEECLKGKNLKVGLFVNDNINYKNYLDYTLYKYSIANSIDFKLKLIDDNLENLQDFDIIFGEYYDLKKTLNINRINYPEKVKTFYNDNGIEIDSNIFPLDLDTYIVLSKRNINNFNLENLSLFKDPIKYNFSFNWFYKESLMSLVHYVLEANNLDLNNVSFESNLSLIKNLYLNSNKDILKSNYLELYNSYLNDENVFSLFNDGVLLYKDIAYESFQLLPKSKYKWDSNKGKFIERINTIPYSFFGFSAYLNNNDHSGFLCFLIEKDTRIFSFKDFNIQLSPLSKNEVEPHFQNIPEDYLKILDLKNKYIIQKNYKHYNEVIGIISSKSDYINVIDHQNFLNIVN